MNFYVMETLGSFSYATFDMEEPYNLADLAEHCPKCGKMMGSFLIWAPPRRAILEKKKIGDFIYGSPPGFLISKRVIEAYNKENLSGLVIYPEQVEIVKIGKAPNPNPLQPEYYFARPIQSMTMLDAEASGLVMEEVDCEYCRRGNTVKYDHIVIDESTWTGHDIFYPRGAGVVVASQRFIDMVERYKLTNFIYKPAYEYSRDWRLRHG